MSTLNNAQQLEQDDFLDIQIKVAVLAKLLQQQKLCAEDLHCQNHQHKHILLNLLLEAVKV
ncbi:MAG: hypothetical protein NWQ54_14665 [Paraglaciecola sp.]|uniref:hypothetical protein n=1 Tax=Pseudomonadati TaxID=3379134 RepID=UPI00273F892E|nr:hypothetical protein [Paraglaciecola sp.]MDP5031147.1 hypothetical protein [Paraglaciecola sp.]MDP5040637.1 hypothetical protein [Paraglaciecola sp.]MDP5132124.1 hypothetical protein [Paraglaciecola sp.]